MQTVYHRPGTLQEVLTLLQRDASRLLAGGTVLNALPPAGPVELVDLQALGLDTIRPGPGSVELGAMARLRDLVESQVVPPLLRELARREGPNTLRNMATVGGTVAAADPESELLAGLLVFEAVVTVIGPEGDDRCALPDVLADPSRLAGSLITAVTVSTDGSAAAARTGRTPADRPIVAVVGRIPAGGSLRLAFTGVASTPVGVDLASAASLNPPGDFRGSPAYRRHLAAVLASRVASRLGVPS